MGYRNLKPKMRRPIHLAYLEELQEEFAAQKFVEGIKIEELQTEFIISSKSLEKACEIGAEFNVTTTRPNIRVVIIQIQHY